MSLQTLMLSEPQRDLLRDKGTRLGRALIGLLFLLTGLMMLSDVGGTISYFENYNLPFPALLVWLVIILKLVAGTFIIIGRHVGLAAVSLIGFTALVTIIAHRDFSDPSLLKNLAIIGALLYLMAFGPGGSNIKLIRVENQMESGDA